jgi:hypothetical protein
MGLLILDVLQKEKEDLEEISSELELVDEEDKVPCVSPLPILIPSLTSSKLI